jgi:AraC-like DNA-binding protein
VEPRFAAEARERLQPWRVRTTAAVGREMFLSERQLRRRFLTVFGFAPKELQRILRFQVFLALVQGPRRDQVRFAHLAAQLGYADQSHLSRECLRLAGLAPGRLVRELAESCGPDHDHTVSFAPLRVRFLQDAVA